MVQRHYQNVNVEGRRKMELAAVLFLGVLVAYGFGHAEDDRWL